MKRSPLARRTSLPRARKPMKRSRLSPVSARRFKQIGDWHPQRTRLQGEAKTELRWAAFARSGGFCEGVKVNPFSGKSSRCMKPISWYDSRFRFEMAHTLAVGKGGSDTLDNVRCLCQYGADACHRGPAGSDHPGPQWMRRNDAN